MEATRKSPAIDAFLTVLTGSKRCQSVREGRCVVCRGVATHFRTPADEHEFTISGMCQSCQDKVFQTQEEL